MNLTDILADRGERNARTLRIYGVVSGVVSDNHDPEGRARVKVKLPWLEENAESDWAKIMSFMTGKERGAIFLPEVGDEVLVAFEHGDIHHPYVLGGLWNSKDPPPDANSDGKNNIRKIKSRSGHELIFCDDDQGRKERVEIHTKAGHKIVLDDSAGAEKIEICDKTGSNSIQIDSVKNDMGLTSQLSMKLHSTQIEITGDASIKLKAPQIEVSADAMLKLSAGGLLEISGAMVKIN
ncbi:MAG: hypothetical protein JNK85_06725 [Verrucomicrobiales bacterium]|nr:hypothetical protein [Verrucomicrobiales bacterium]